MTRPIGRLPFVLVVLAWAPQTLAACLTAASYAGHNLGYKFCEDYLSASLHHQPMPGGSYCRTRECVHQARCTDGTAFDVNDVRACRQALESSIAYFGGCGEFLDVPVEYGSPGNYVPLRQVEADYERGCL